MGLEGVRRAEYGVRGMEGDLEEAATEGGRYMASMGSSALAERLVGR